MKQRDYRFDNLKLLLIFLVVFGHMLELIDNRTFTFDLYLAIYAFHMPAFVFVSGYFARFSPQKILSRLVVPYVIFQVLYLSFGNLLFGASAPIQFATPYWLMWYMLVMVFCYALIPFFDSAKTARSRVAVLALTVVVSLLVGFDDQVGRFLSLSRFFDFLPYFIAGYYLGNSEVSVSSVLGRLHLPRLALIGILAMLAAIGVAYVVLAPAITPNVLYGASSYAAAGYSPLQKAILYLVGSAFIALLLLATPSKRFPVLSGFGAATLSIYLLHGFVARAISASPVSPFMFGEAGNLVLALLLSAVLISLFGSKPVASAFSKYATAKWAEQLIERRKAARPGRNAAHPEEREKKIP